MIIANDTYNFSRRSGQIHSSLDYFSNQVSSLIIPDSFGRIWIASRKKSGEKLDSNELIFLMGKTGLF